MKALIKSIECLAAPDLGFTNFVPANRINFSVPIRVWVGATDGPGEDSFDFDVCTPAWIDDQCSRDGFVIGRHRIVVSSYDRERIRDVLTRLVDRLGAENWDQLANKLSRYGYWEFEDHQ